jgi:predicted RNA-binding Zn ribbon-like protein
MVCGSATVITFALPETGDIMCCISLVNRRMLVILYLMTGTVGRPRRPAADSRPPFLWVGGALCADFVNTVSWVGPGQLANERLRTANDVEDWLSSAGVLPPHNRSPSRAVDSHSRHALFTRTHELRTLTHGVLRELARARGPSPEEVTALNEWVHWAATHTHFAPQGGNGAWGWVPNATSSADEPMSSALAMVVHSIVELLQSDDRRLLRLCANEHCGWVFLDRSRKRNRQWCEMRACGGRAKARRYRARRLDRERANRRHVSKSR